MRRVRAEPALLALNDLMSAVNELKRISATWFDADTLIYKAAAMEKYKPLLDLISAKGHEVEWAKMGSE